MSRYGLTLILLLSSSTAFALGGQGDGLANYDYMVGIDLKSSSWAPAQSISAANNDWLQLADNRTEVMPGNISLDLDVAETEPYQDRLFTAKKIHQYTGVGAIVLGTLAALSPKEEGGAHEYLAKAAAGLGVVTVASGLTWHLDDIEMKNGFGDRDNLHALMATIGTVGMLLAISRAPDNHAGPGVVGLFGMAIGIKMVW